MEKDPVHTIFEYRSKDGKLQEVHFEETETYVENFIYQMYEDGCYDFHFVKNERNYKFAQVHDLLW